MSKRQISRQKATARANTTAARTAAHGGRPAADPKNARDPSLLDREVEGQRVRDAKVRSKYDPSLADAQSGESGDSRAAAAIAARPAPGTPLPLGALATSALNAASAKQANKDTAALDDALNVSGISAAAGPKVTADARHAPDPDPGPGPMHAERSRVFAEDVTKTDRLGRRRLTEDDLLPRVGRVKLAVEKAVRPGAPRLTPDELAGIVAALSDCEQALAADRDDVGDGGTAGRPNDPIGKSERELQREADATTATDTADDASDDASDGDTDTAAEARPVRRSGRVRHA